MGRGPASGCRVRVANAKGVTVQTIDKGVDATRWILLGNLVIKHRGQKPVLGA